MEETKSKTSAILGKGYGDKHNWQRIQTYRVVPSENLHLSTQAMLAKKGTEYKCRVCGQFFVHRYDLVGNIFKAMKEAGITETCGGPAVPHTPLAS